MSLQGRGEGEEQCDSCGMHQKEEGEGVVTDLSMLTIMNCCNCCFLLSQLFLQSLHLVGEGALDREVSPSQPQEKPKELLKVSKRGFLYLAGPHCTASVPPPL